MIELQNYLIREKLLEDGQQIIYKGCSSCGELPVLIKTLKQQNNAFAVSKLIYEYELLRDLDVEGVFKPVSLERSGKTLAMVLEDLGFIPLREYTIGVVGLPLFFDLAIQLAQILDKLQQKMIIHGDLRPENIFIHPGTAKVQIIGFEKEFVFPEREESLKYAAPEKLGLGRSDYRSDYYHYNVI